MTEKITISNKVSNKFLAIATHIITCPLLVFFRDRTRLQADFDTRSSTDSMIASIDISRNSATSNIASIPGDDLPSNQPAQVVALTPLIVANCPSDKFKNNSFSAAKSVMSIYADFATCFDCMVRDRLVACWLQFAFKYLHPFSNYLRNWNITTLRLSFQKLVIVTIYPNFNRFIFKHFYNPIFYYCTLLWYNHSVAKKIPPPADNREGSCRLLLCESPEANTYEYNIFEGTLCTLCTTVRPHADMGDAVMQDYLATVPKGREGYIYLIHAEGTNRYKIGRSVNPIARAADIQKQAPYKLKIVRSSWTLDAPGDEASLHREFADYRVHGEWFEFERDNIHSYVSWGLDMAFDYPPTIYKAVNLSISKLGQFLGLEISNHDVMSSTGADILTLYCWLSSRQDLQLTQDFFEGTLQSIIKDRYHSVTKEDLESEAFLKDLVNFIAGAIASFKVMVLKKGGVA